jgi:hypothetical protein
MKIAVNKLDKAKEQALKLLLPTVHFEGLGHGEFVLTFYDEGSLEQFKLWQEENANADV